MPICRVETFDLQAILDKTMPNEDALASFFKANSNLNIPKIDSHSQIEDLLKKIPSNVNLGSIESIDNENNSNLEDMPRVASLDYIRAFLNNQHNNGMLNRDNSLFSPEKSLSLPPQFDLDGQTLMETSKVRLPTIIDPPTTTTTTTTTTNNDTNNEQALGAGKTLNTTTTMHIAALQNATAAIDNPQVSALLMSVFNPAYAMPHLLNTSNNKNATASPQSVPTSELAGMSAGSAEAAAAGSGGATSLRKRAAAGAARRKRNATNMSDDATAAANTNNNKKQRRGTTAAVRFEGHNNSHGGGGTATGASSETALKEQEYDDDEDDDMMLGATGGGGDKQVARRERRMLSNRESARRSRKRKQEHLVNLEKEAQELRLKVEELSKLVAAKDDEILSLKAENEQLHGGRK